MAATRLILRLVLFVLPLGLDTFALSTVLGVTPMPGRTRVRMALTFAAAEGVMPAIGLLIGLPLGNVIGAWSDYIAGVLIAGLGFWLWRKERHEDDDDDDEPLSADPQSGLRGKVVETGDGEAAKVARAVRSGGWALVGLALSVSLDELAVGFSFGMLGFPLAPALVLIALQALLVSLLGQWVGIHAGRRLGERAEGLVGPALCLLGLWFLVARVLGIPI